MNVIGIVFLECYHLLCHFHIQKNVQAKCKMLVNSIDSWDVVIRAGQNNPNYTALPKTALH